MLPYLNGFARKNSIDFHKAQSNGPTKAQLSRSNRLPPPVGQISLQTRVYSSRYEKANKRQLRRLPPRFLPAAAAPSPSQARQDEARQVTAPVVVRPLFGLAPLFPFLAAPFGTNLA